MKHLTLKQKRDLYLILIACTIFFPVLILDKSGMLDGLSKPLKLLVYFVPYLIVGLEILYKAVRNILRGNALDENFLMTVATIAAFAIGEYPEACAVMLFYSVGELFQGYAVGKSRDSIAQMMSIAPEYANLETEGGITEVDPEDVPIGSIILIRAGERIPIDGIVLEGESFLDTSSLTGESVPRRVVSGEAVFSGCLNGSGILKIRTEKLYEDSTVSKVLELVENSSAKKARLENFITRFARWYTPIVVLSALLLAVVPPLFLGNFPGWIHRACIFLIVSCPCALVISVPLGFFGGIGAASKIGVLIKGGNDLEVVSHINTIAFDKTGTLTKGEFRVQKVFSVSDVSDAFLLEAAAHGESLSTHPIARSILEAYQKPINPNRLSEIEEFPGRGIRAFLDGKELLVGNRKLLSEHGIETDEAEQNGSSTYVSFDGKYLGYLLISDTVKENAAKSLAAIKSAGVKRTVLLSGDHREAAEAVAKTLSIDSVYSELLPADKVEQVELLLSEETNGGKLAFAGDGINDAPVLMRADVGIAMGSLGSDAAIEAADVVLMDDDLSKIADVIEIAKKTMRIVRENIIFALGVKFLVILLGALGIATLWEAVFGDVGVTVIAILNSMRAMHFRKHSD